MVPHLSFISYDVSRETCGVFLVFEFFVPEPGFGIPYNPIENSSWNSLWWHTDAPIPSPWFKSLCDGGDFDMFENGYCRCFSPLVHHRYSAGKIQQVFGTISPVMSDLMEQEETFTPDDDETQLIRNILPERVRHLFWIMELSSGKDIH